MKTVSRRSLNSRLFRWHQARRRPLQIREAANPWQVLVAEVMSQQTGIERVGPAWRRFVDRWPTPADLAEAGTHELLAAWAGLGYNRRALALRECARTIVADHGGRVPATVAELDALPGIGPYTARAVAATAFGSRSRRWTSTSGASSRGCSACRHPPLGSRLWRTISCRAVSPVVGSMPSWISPRERARLARRCAMRVPSPSCALRAGSAVAIEPQAARRSRSR